MSPKLCLEFMKEARFRQDLSRKNFHFFEKRKDGFQLVQKLLGNGMLMEVRSKSKGILTCGFPKRKHISYYDNYKKVCPTEVNEYGKIVGWGGCNRFCYENNVYTSVNLHLLTTEECKVMLKHCPTCGKQKSINSHEICAGKKHENPDKIVSFKRKKKKVEQYRTDKDNAEKYDLSPPSKYRYAIQKTRSQLGSFPLNDSYPFDWFIGGEEMCQVDIGSPLLRNIKVGEEVKAVQIGVLTKINGHCGDLNAPLIYTKISSVYDWIKKTIKHSEQDKLCQKQKS